MTNDLQVFDNLAFGAIHIVMLEGEPWFIGKELTDILGYQNSSKAVLDHVDESDRKCLNFKANNDLLLANKFNELRGVLWANPNDFNDKWLISESGFYSLIFASALPSAKQFKHWVTDEVLPSIRKTGAYGVSHQVDWEGARTILSTLYSGNQLTLALDNVYRNACGGKSLLGLAESPKLIAPNKQQLLTVTDLGKLHKPPLSSHEMNKLLIATGMQNKIGKSTYIATDEGEKYSEYVYTGKQHHSGKPVRYLSWYASVLDAIED